MDLTTSHLTIFHTVFYDFYFSYFGVHQKVGSVKFSYVAAKILIHKFFVYQRRCFVVEISNLKFFQCHI